MEENLDFTKVDVGMGPRGRYVKVCPVCGLTGEFTVYDSGDSIYVHTGYVKNGWLVVEVKCMFSA